MNKKLRNVLLAFGALLVLSLLAFPLWSRAQQKQQEESNQVENQKQKAALQTVNQNAVATRFYNKLQSKNSEWQLDRASYAPIKSVDGAISSSITNLFVKNDKGAEIVVQMFEYDSPKEAESAFNVVRQKAFFENCGQDNFGDKCKKVYNGNGKFGNLSFINGNFYVSISGKSEETAKHFAEYALQSINNK